MSTSTNLPVPEGVNAAQWEKFLPAIRESLESLAAVGQLGPFDATSESFWAYTKVQYAGFDVPVALNALATPDKVRSFCRLLPKVAKFAAEYSAGRTDEFYCNVHAALRPILGDAKGATMAEGAAYEMLKQRGVIVHS